MCKPVLICVALVVAFTICRAIEANDFKIIVATKPRGDAAATITLRVPNGATTTSAQLFVHAPTTLENVTFYGQLKGKGVPSGSITVRPQVAQVAEEGPTQQGPVTIPANTPVGLSVSIEGVTSTETFTGSLIAEQGGKSEEIAAIVIQPSTTLEVAGKSDTGKLELSSLSSNFAHQFRIDSTNDGGVTDFEVVVTPLVGEDGSQVTPHDKSGSEIKDPISLRLDSLGSVFVEMSATLPTLQKYHGQIVLLHDGRRIPNSYSVTRVEPDLQFIGAPATGAMKFETEKAAFNRQLRIVNGNLAKIDQVKIIVTQLASPTLTLTDVNMTVSIVTPGQTKKDDGSESKQPPGAQPGGAQPSATPPPGAQPATQPPATQPPATQPPGTPAPGAPAPGAQTAAKEDLAPQPPGAPPPGAPPPGAQTPAKQTPAKQTPVAQPPVTKPPVTQSEWTGSLEGLATLVVNIEATLEQTGDYEGVVTIQYDGKQKQQALKLTRSRPTPTVAFLAATKAYGSGHVIWWFTLHETGGKQVSLSKPDLVNLAWLSADKEAIGGIEDADVAFYEGNCTSPVTNIELAPGQMRRFKMEVKKLNAAGTYTGQVTVGLADGQSVAQPITILVRDSVWLALALIAAGVSISFGFRFFYSRIRPQWLQQERAAALNKELVESERQHAPLEDSESDVLAAMRARMNDLYELSEQDNAADFDTVYVEIDHKLTVLPEWIGVRRALAAVEPAKAVEALWTKLLPVTKYLRGITTFAPTLMAVHRGELLAIESEIPKKLSKFLGDQLAEFQADVSESFQDDPIDGMVEQIHEVQVALDDGKFADARELFQLAQGEYVTRLVDRLREQVLAKEPPYGFAKQEWQDFAAKVVDRIDGFDNASPDLAQAQYEAVYQFFYRTLLDKLADEIGTQKDRVGRDDRLKAQREELEATFDALTTQTVAARKHLKDGDLRSAATKYAETIKLLTESQDHIKSLGGAMGGPTPRQASEAAQVVVAGGVNVIARQHRTQRTLRRLVTGTLTPTQIRRKIVFYDILLTLMVGIVAVLLGLRILWASDPTWGGFNAWLTAFLWGLGLHQVAVTSAFGGIQGLQQQFAGKKPQGG